ncbi:MAG: MATE family efflux transporter [Streptococcaceae bacterium]|jgi:putative MATE family efflux protein|nr:MATE family efflux transporter [Streptococcaceae bacterium]
MKDFTQGSINKQLISFSAPMLMSALFQQINNLADAAIVGRFISGNALAAVGISLNASSFLISAIIGLTTGASVLISQYYGAKNHEKMQRTLATSFIFLGTLAAIMTILGLVFSPFLLELLQAPAEIFADALVYMRIIMSGVVFVVFYNMYKSYLLALGNSKIPLYILIVTSVVNIIIDLVMVAGLGFGLWITALTTILAQFLAALICYIYVRRNVPQLQIKKFLFDKALFLQILKYGLPASLQLSFVNLASLTITRLINSFGAAAMAAITLAGRIDQMVNTPIVSISQALSTFVAQNMGARKEKRARKALKMALIQMLIVAVVISSILWLVGDNLIAAFTHYSDPNAGLIRQIGEDYLYIIVTFYFLFAFLFLFNGFYRGVGDAVMAMVFPVISLSIRTISAYMLVHLAGMGPEALAWSIPIGWGITGILSIFYYRSQRWKGKMAI